MTINPVLGKNHSTDTCLFLNDKILKGFDDGLLTGMILTELQKAIDMISHYILLLSIIGFPDHIFSEVSSISCSMPQASILGSLLFSFYVHDMPMAVKCNLFL